MSKQYLSLPALSRAHRTDIFALAVTPPPQPTLISVSAESAIKIHGVAPARPTTDPLSITPAPNSKAANASADARAVSSVAMNLESDPYPLTQVLHAVHPLGAHHVAVSADGTRMASVGFGGECRVWRFRSEENGKGDGMWVNDGYVGVELKAGQSKTKGKEEIWAIALSGDGRYLAGTSGAGGASVWDLDVSPARKKVAEWGEGRQGWGMCVDFSPDSTLLATGHATGSILLYSPSTSRLLHGLPSSLLAALPVRALHFSPGGSLLAAAGDSRSVVLFDPQSGECVASLRGHSAWVTALAWNETGREIVSGSVDGNVRVWGVEQRASVASYTHAGGAEDGDEAGEGKAVWSVQWLPRTRAGEAQRFVAAGTGGGVEVWREASGG